MQGITVDFYVASTRRFRGATFEHHFSEYHRTERNESSWQPLLVRTRDEAREFSDQSRS
jgi:hypothetical protein